MKTINNSIIELGDIDDSGKGRHFKSRFIKDGLVKIEGHGIVLIKKETLDSSLSSMIGTPVIIKHQKVTDENADELRVGIISDAYFNEPDGWYYCEGIIWDKKAQKLIEQKGWSVSCSYDFLAYNDEGGEENNIKYDKEFTKLNFVHLALVNNPRYERANIVFNCKVDNDRWITIKPHGDESDDYRRLKLEDGETPKEAIERIYGKKDDESSTKQLGLRGFSKYIKEIEKNKKEIERKDQEERSAIRKKIKDLRDAYNVYIEQYTPSSDWAKQKEDRDFRTDLSDRIYKAEQEAIDKYNLDENALEDFLNETNQYDKQSDIKEERIEARHKHQEVVKKHNQAYKDFEDGKITMDELEKVDAELEKSNREFYGNETETKEQKSELDQKREAYESTLKTLRDAEHRKWKPKDNDDWIDAIKTETQAKKDLTNLRRDYAESIMANFEETDNNPYQDKIDSKRQYYAEKSAELQKSSEKNWQMHEDTRLPLGQPIINPATARAYKRTNGYFDKSIEDYNKSKYYQEKAKSYGSSGISADDKNAIKKLATKYNSIKRTHQQMLDANKIIKGKGTDEDKLNKLIASGWSEQKAKELITPSRWGGYVGFPSYELTGNTAEMRRIIDRVISLHQKPMKAQERAEKDTTDYSKYGFEVERNTDINRLQLKFPDKPDANTRSQLKSYGFRWSPREGAWQRQLTQNAEYSLRQFINGINNEKEYEMSLLDEIKRLITNVENDKEQDMDIENGKVDKRKLIDEVAGIMKSAGCDDEDIRTAIGKMEKIGYDKSEDDTADNCGGKKVKNEEEPKEVKNEEPEKDKKEVEEVKEEIKEDVGNKCDNSKSSFDKINGIYNSIKQVAQGRQFVSRQDKLDNAVEYFK